MKKFPPFAVGDRFVFVDEVGGGEVIALLGSSQVRVRTDDGFEFDVPAKRLVKRERERDRRLHAVSDHQVHLAASDDRLADRLEKDRRKGTPTRKAHRSERIDPEVMEVDLHLEELVGEGHGMSDGEQLRYQLSYFERMLNTAIRERKRRLIVIHGVGAGVLREEVRNILEHYEHLTFDDADPRRYGYGATEVLLGRH